MATRDEVLVSPKKVIGGYIEKSDWRVNENSNEGYSYASLLSHVSSTVVAGYVLDNIYPEEISRAHTSGDFHIHDLASGIIGYCAGWSLGQLLKMGFVGSAGRASAAPAKHFDTATGQMINFMCTLQTEWAGAQAFSSFDTLLAPFVKFDKLEYREVKQKVQQLIFGLNIASRWGQTPFTNLTLDWTVPEDLADMGVVVGGETLSQWCYGDFEKEMAMINRAFLECMAAGDRDGRIFTFPIPTYNITRDFDWEGENAQLLFEVTGKYGMPYFQNFVNSELNPRDVRSMCCRLSLDLTRLEHKTGGLFGAGEQTGSLGVITINMPRLGYNYQGTEFFDRLDELMILAKDSLEIKRNVVQENMDRGLMPYSSLYLGTLDHHFNTIGLVGMHECCLNRMGCGIHADEGHQFALQVLDHMRDKMTEFQKETGHMYNLEATPAEGTSYRLAKIDVERYPRIITGGSTASPYYTNSTQLPVGFTEDIFEAFEMQDDLQCKYTGGTVLHGFIGERIEDPYQTMKLVRSLATNYKMPYFTITPTFSICPEHGYISGKHETCPVCVG